MKHFRHTHRQEYSSPYAGFTIVELMVVIVVIAILATISYVGYYGLQDRASKSAVRSDLTAAAELLNADLVRSGGTSFPGDINDIDRGAGLPASDGTEYQYTVNNSVDPPTFCLTATKDTLSFYITQEGDVSEGGCPGHGVGGAAAITNMATNPSVEVTGGWSSNNGSLYPVARVTSVKRSGNQALESHHLSSSTTLLSVYSAGATDGYGFPVQPDTTYNVSYYFRSGVAHQGRVACSFRLDDGSYTSSQTGVYVQGVINQWTRASITCDSPPNATKLRVGLLVMALSTQPAGTSAYADDLIAVEGTDEYDYMDGSSPSWLWNGVPGGSTSTGPRKLVAE